MSSSIQDLTRNCRLGVGGVLLAAVAWGQVIGALADESAREGDVVRLVSPGLPPKGADDSIASGAATDGGRPTDAGPRIALAAEQLVKFVTPSPLPKVFCDPRVQPAMKQQATIPSSTPQVVRTQADDRDLPLPPTGQAAPPETVQPELVDPLQLSADVRPFRPITELTADISLPPGQMPGDVEAARPATPPVGDVRLFGGWTPFDFQWVATNMRHRPLYFEQVNLERYGYSVGPCLQPIVSGAHFFAVIPALPYKMTVDCPRDCIYTLGHYRPGDCGVPRRWHRTPWRWSAAAVEVGTVAGLILLIP